MGGCADNSRECSSDSKEDDTSAKKEAAVAESLSHVRLVDAPILLFVKFHKALRSELAELRRITLEVSESESCAPEFISELFRRFEFLKLAYKYHFAAEDQVIFPALDVRTKNVVCAYSLEHESIDDLFNSIFHRLDELKQEDKNILKPFQELVFCLGTIQTSMCQHMLKEEEQVFPLVMQQFSPGEQASLVWQFICSVPVILLEELFPWMISFLSPDEQVEVKHCIEDMTSNEKLLQEVVISWLASDKKSCFGINQNIVGGQSAYGSEGLNWSPMLNSCQLTREENLASVESVGENPVDGLHLWQGAIMRDLKESLEELFQLRISSTFSKLDSIVVKIKFLADVILFYSNALDKFFFPLLNQLHFAFLPSFKFLHDSRVESLQLLLYTFQDSMPLEKFVEKLYRELEFFLMGVGKEFAFQETKVLPAIRKKCSHKLQQRILYMSLHMLPLGLLKCVITWFSAQLSEGELRFVFHSIKREDFSGNDSFASLLHEWFRIGYSGKTSVENFGMHLQHMFKTRNYLLYKQIKDGAGSSFLNSNVQPCKGSTIGLVEQSFAIKEQSSFSYSSSSGTKYETSYFSEINLHIYFPEAMKTSFTKHDDDKNHEVSVLNDAKPIDLIFFFHKALKKDLEYFVFGSVQLAENVGLLDDFKRRFQLVQFLYQIHSDAEDQIAFPALEEKGKVQNISHSYTIDHKFEVEQFSKVTFILDELSKLHASVFSIGSGKMDQRMQRHQKLCLGLHDMCKSLHKLISDHVDREEIELWPLFREFFSVDEQEQLIGSILGRTRAEILQDMIPWLMAHLTPEEQHDMITLWRNATRKTMFDKWLGEWWEGHDRSKVEDVSNTPPSLTEDPLEIISKYLSPETLNEVGGDLFGGGIKFSEKKCIGTDVEKSELCNVDDDEAKFLSGDLDKEKCSECARVGCQGDEKRKSEVADFKDHMRGSKQLSKQSLNSKHHEHLLTMSQEDLEAAIRRVSRDSSLGTQKKSYIIQNLMMSRWIVKQQVSHSEIDVLDDGGGVPGQHPSFRDSLKKTFGCEHYKRNCKLLASCCNQLYTCIRCHDEMADHSMDRKSITKMMCMNCLTIQPIGNTCSNASCGNLSMARYFCRICKLFDDEREIYHCPYCNLCRVGKGLGIDYFHCMNCNACMARSLSVHICREKCFEDNCPICHEFIFTSTSPVKALACGHLMHSNCFREYTYIHYTCPICSKSLGDMQVYFRMLDALLAEEKIPDEYLGKTQVILCHDCEKRGSSPFHWIYHKCPNCGSYNTRPL